MNGYSDRSYWPDVALVCTSVEVGKPCINHLGSVDPICPGKLPPDCEGFHTDPSCGISIKIGYQGLPSTWSTGSVAHHHHDERCPQSLDHDIDLYLVDKSDQALAQTTLSWLLAAVDDGFGIPPCLSVVKSGRPSHMADAAGTRLFEVRIKGQLVHYGQGWGCDFSGVETVMTDFETSRNWQGLSLVTTPVLVTGGAGIYHQTYGRVVSLAYLAASTTTTARVKWLSLRPHSFMELV